jgi:hypothetical protein
MSDALIQLFAEVLDVDLAKLDEESSPENVKEWDSLAAMNLVATLTGDDKYPLALAAGGENSSFVATDNAGSEAAVRQGIESG